MSRSSLLQRGSAGQVGKPALPAAQLLALFSVAASLLPGAAEWLQYDRTLIAAGELWRPITSHFVHWSGDHLFWDVLALALLGWLCEREFGTCRFLVCVTASAIFIPLALWFAEPQMPTYRGLSGIDSALFALLALRMIGVSIVRRDWLRSSLAACAAAAFAAKIGYEYASGATLFVDSTVSGMIPMPLAHIAGSLVGPICLLPKGKNRQKAPLFLPRFI